MTTEGNSGSCRLHAKLLDSEIFQRSDRTHLWLWIMLTAAKTRTTRRLHGRQIEVEPGQIVTTIAEIMRRLPLDHTRKQMQRLVNWFERRESITKTPVLTSGGRVIGMRIEVTNWAVYQVDVEREAPPDLYKDATKEKIPARRPTPTPTSAPPTVEEGEPDLSTKRGRARVYAPAKDCLEGGRYQRPAWIAMLRDAFGPRQWKAPRRAHTAARKVLLDGVPLETLVEACAQHRIAMERENRPPDKRPHPATFFDRGDWETMVEEVSAEREPDECPPAPKREDPAGEPAERTPSELWDDALQLLRNDMGGAFDERLMELHPVEQTDELLRLGTDDLMVSLVLSRNREMLEAAAAAIAARPMRVKVEHVQWIR